MIRRMCATAVGLLLLAASAGPARAWESSAKWGTHVVGYRVNPSNNDVSSAKALTAIRTSADAWTTQTKAAFRFRYDGASTATLHGLDGKNVVLFRDAVGSSSTVRASTYTWKLLGVIFETDIVFWDKSMSFVTASMPCNNQIVIENTAIHELGHALGLDHSTEPDATMWSKSKVCATKRLTLHKDDITGVETLYPCATAAQCDDANLCTADTCMSKKCERTPIKGCCVSAADCGDGDPCTKDSCKSNVCQNASIKGCCKADADCDDGDACTKDSCKDNACKNVPITGCGGSDAGLDAPLGDAQPLDAQPADAQPADDLSLKTSEAGTAGGDGPAAPAPIDPGDSGCALAPGARDGAWSSAALLGLLLLLRRRRR